ncbi:hypothetical protein M153_13370002508 [Pseudoloma neurophilia]|uniref:Uncharacterized protein n=1 Tax=Pseudoloma neurophilia TaxID=146866 RepID=A0A0R0LUZ8_9MICR|nr:hypothetical protein M153_13370002508 [Pseudoloma neurophilia]
MSGFPHLAFLHTANKNVYSNFMRTDQSYFTKESEQYPMYRKPEDKFVGMLMDQTGIKIWDIDEEDGIFIRENPFEKTENSNEQKNDSELPFFLELSDLFQDGHLNQKCVKKNLFDFDKLPRLANCFVSFVYHDGILSNELLFMVHYLINTKACKGVLCLPLSIIMSVSTDGHAVYIFKNENKNLLEGIHEKKITNLDLNIEKSLFISIIDDFVLVDTKKVHKQSFSEEEPIDHIKTMIDDKETNIFEFFSAELAHLNDLDPSQSTGPFLCDLCWEWLSYPDQGEHQKKVHVKNNKCECVRTKKDEGKKKRKRRTKLEMLESKRLMMSSQENPRLFFDESQNKNDDSTINESQNQEEQSSKKAGGSDDEPSKEVKRRKPRKKTTSETKQPEKSTENEENLKSLSKSGENIEPHDHVHFVFEGESHIDQIVTFLTFYQKKHNKKLNVICRESFWNQINEKLQSLQLKNSTDSSKSISVEQKSSGESLVEDKSLFKHFIPSDCNIYKNLAELLSIELAKELWMTDCEWNRCGVRIFKEKLLFYL